MPDDLVIRQFIEANYASQRAYEFAPYDGPVVVFRAGDDPFGGSLVDNAMGWRRVAVGPLDVRVVPGGHITILEEPNVQRLAGELVDANDRAMAVVPPGDRATIDRQLRTALAEQRFGGEVALLLERRTTLDTDARQLLDQCDATGQAIASMARNHGRQAIDALAAAGLSATLGVVPTRQQHCSAAILLDGPADDVVKHVVQAVEVLAGLGYLRQTPRHLDSWEAHAATHDSCTLIRPDSSTTRLTLSWRQVAADRRAATEPDDGHDLGIFLGTPTSLIEPVLAIGGAGPDDLVVDIGCGDGRVVIEAVHRFGCRARGIEIDPVLADLARKKVAEAGLSHRIEIIEADAAVQDQRTAALLVDATMVFLFLPTEIAAGLLHDLLRQLDAGARVVAHEQLAVEWPVAPDHSELVVGADAVTVASVWRTPMPPQIN
jgi:SAM-dependent methyltransferase